jgi:hypothetical protein
VGQYNVRQGQMVHEFLPVIKKRKFGLYRNFIDSFLEKQSVVLIIVGQSDIQNLHTP